MNGRAREAHLRFTERRRREDEAPRLHTEVPRLRTLRLDVEERRGESSLAETRHVRHVVVDHAPALFVLGCGDPDCRDGGHDVTDALVRHLGEHSTSFSLEDVCMGHLRGAPCGRIVRVLVTATYADPSPKPHSPP
jgi:hypothetical protein